MQLQHALIAALAGSVAGHIHMVDPPPITAPENPNSGSHADYDINSPLSSMSDYPCKNSLQYLGKPEGASVATYAPGSAQKMKMGSGATHNGGSCQLSLSYDQGKSFTVIKSIIGNCPTVGGTFDFNVPGDAPEGDAVFSWSWINHTGNREFYQNCAAVTIGSGGNSTKRADEEVRAPSAAADLASEEVKEKEVKRQTTAFSSRPQIFVANLGGQYCVPEGVDVMYPNPGPDVEDTSTSPGKPTSCGGGSKRSAEDDDAAARHPRDFRA